MKSIRRHVASAVVLVFAVCPLAVADTSADEATIHSLVESWSAAAQAKDLDRFASIYASDAVLMLEGAPDMVGREAIRSGIGGLMQDPHFDLSFEADEVVVAEAGDLAYETGRYSLSMSDADGNPTSQAGRYVVVWRKEPDGNWKVVIDAPVSDPPAAD